MVCVDDQHNTKVGEPGFPVAAVGRDWEAVVASYYNIQVGDHDYTKARLPLQLLLFAISLKIWINYSGTVKILLQKHNFQPIQPLSSHC